MPARSQLSWKAAELAANSPQASKHLWLPSRFITDFPVCSSSTLSDVIYSICPKFKCLMVWRKSIIPLRFLLDTAWIYLLSTLYATPWKKNLKWSEIAAASFFSTLALSPDSCLFSIECYEPHSWARRGNAKATRNIKFYFSPACDLRGAGTSCLTCATPGSLLGQQWHKDCGISAVCKECRHFSFFSGMPGSFIMLQKSNPCCTPLFGKETKISPCFTAKLSLLSCF